MGSKDKVFLFLNVGGLGGFDPQATKKSVGEIKQNRSLQKIKQTMSARGFGPGKIIERGFNADRIIEVDFLTILTPIESSKWIF